MTGFDSGFNSWESSGDPFAHYPSSAIAAAGTMPYDSGSESSSSSSNDSGGSNPVAAAAAAVAAAFARKPSRSDQ